MLTRLVWPHYDGFGAPPVDAFWVECDAAEAALLLRPGASLAEAGRWPGEAQARHCFLVARDLRAVMPMAWRYPHSPLWNAFNPFRSLPQPVELESLHQLRALPVHERTPEIPGGEQPGEGSGTDQIS